MLTTVQIIKTENISSMFDLYIDTWNNEFLLISNDFVHKYIKFKFHSFNVMVFLFQ